MRHWKLTAALLAGMSLAACEVHPAPQSAPTPAPSPHTLPNRETQPQPVISRLPDCGDGDAPCVTYDDGPQGNGMYLVTSYQPYTALKLPVCDAEDYPTNLPCVWRKQDAKTGEWLTFRAKA